MSFADTLKSGKFIVTAELNPPKGTDIADVLRKAAALKGKVDAFNLTDSASAIMTMAPIPVAYRLLELGVEPILQITSRDRNRLIRVVSAFMSNTSARQSGSTGW